MLVRKRGCFPHLVHGGQIGFTVSIWAWRRNHRYASIVCNLERRRVMTLLPDREPATAQAWLAAHPTIAIVARDRGGGYGEAAAKALPHAVQVADR
jgi:transposase